MITKKLFLASSAELKEDRRDFEVFINRKNKDWAARGVSLELVIWEDFLDAVSQTRLQDEYNREIRRCDLFVILCWTKVGRYTQEEFETAFAQFKAANRPFIFTYFKDAPISTGSAAKQDLMSLWAFQERLDALGHFYTRYKTSDALQLHFSGQLDKLVANGFITFAPEPAAAVASQATRSGRWPRGAGGGTQCTPGVIRPTPMPPTLGTRGLGIPPRSAASRPTGSVFTTRSATSGSGHAVPGCPATAM